MMNDSCSAAIFDVMHDVIFLSKFSRAHMIGRGVWDNASAALRKRFLLQGYVQVETNRVLLTKTGLEVMGYREETA